MDNNVFFCCTDVAVSPGTTAGELEAMRLELEMQKEEAARELADRDLLKVWTVTVSRH